MTRGPKDNQRTTRSQIRAVDDAQSNPLSDAKSNSTAREEPLSKILSFYHLKFKKTYFPHCGGVLSTRWVALQSGATSACCGVVLVVQWHGDWWHERKREGMGVYQLGVVVSRNVQPSVGWAGYHGHVFRSSTVEQGDTSGVAYCT